MNKKYLLTIKAEDRPGLLHLLTGHLNRKLVPIISLTAAETDIHGIVLVTMEINISDRALTPLILKLENIIEVFAVEAQLIDEAIVIRSALFQLHTDFLTSVGAMELAKHRAQIVNVVDQKVTVSYSGCEAEIQKLYIALEGPYLLGINKSAPISDNRLISHEEQSSVIIRLAA